MKDPEAQLSEGQDVVPQAVPGPRGVSTQLDVPLHSRSMQGVSVQSMVDPAQTPVPPQVSPWVHGSSSLHAGAGRQRQVPSTFVQK